MRAAELLLASLALLGLGHSIARRVHVDGRQLFVDGDPFHVKGICYSPTPVNESVYFAPYGDYFGPEYSFIWNRDLPLIKAMGANVVRTYGWQPTNDHTAFLDAAAANGVYVMATYYTGGADETPVRTKDDRDKAVHGFRKLVRKYADHPSLLFWSFGNELNGVWNDFLTEIGKDPDQEPCNWNEKYDDLGGCWIHTNVKPFPPGSPCYEAAGCVYKRLFSWINDAAEAAKAEADVLVVSAFADVDMLHEKVGRVGHVAPSVDAWTAQVYRGISFGNFFEAMANNTDKPVLLTEYGVDAYHDECGSATKSPCFNTVEDTLPTPGPHGNRSGSYEDGEAQALFALKLTAEIDAASSIGDECANADHTTPHGLCSCIGGFLMSWTDEYWKGAKSQAKCEPTYGSLGFSAAGCDHLAHVTCGDWDASAHDLCGYWLDAAPDHYVNEEWFGITSPTQCAPSVDALTPREVYWRMRKLWTGKGHDSSLFGECEDLLEGHCVALGDGGASGHYGGLFGGSSSSDGSDGGGSSGGGGSSSSSHAVSSSSSSPKYKGKLPCSGRGTCTTDWHKCEEGAGLITTAGTPCCTCEPGYAGAGCTEWDFRVYVGLGAAGLLAALVVLMAVNSVASAIRRRVKADLHEPLLE